MTERKSEQTSHENGRSTEYGEMLSEFQGGYAELFNEHQSVVQARFKNDTQMTEDERRAIYMDQVYPDFERRQSEMQQGFVQKVSLRVNALNEAVFGGKPSSQLSSHLVALANVPDERLSELLQTSLAANDPQLERAVVLAAKERGLSDVVGTFVKRDPEREAAYEELIRFPSPERLATVAEALTLPRADDRSLAASHEAVKRSQAESQANERRRTSFFGR